MFFQFCSHVLLCRKFQFKFCPLEMEVLPRAARTNARFSDYMNHDEIKSMMQLECVCHTNVTVPKLATNRFKNTIFLLLIYC